jgi:hypothetical protein
MHNDTPLGVSMHLKELDRQAGSTSRSLEPRTHNTGRATAISAGRARFCGAFVRQSGFGRSLRDRAALRGARCGCGHDGGETASGAAVFKSAAKKFYARPVREPIDLDVCSGSNPAVGSYAEHVG